MGFRHTAGLVVLGLVLFCCLFAANLVVGVNRTVLSQDFVTDSLAEEEVYEQAVTAVQERIRNRTGNVSVDLSSVLTTAFLRDQVERNVGRLYDFLHGRSDSFILAVNLSRLEPRIADAAQVFVREELASRDSRIGALLANRSSYQRVKEEFRERQLDRIQQLTPGNQTRQELLTIYDQQRERIRDRLSGEYSFGDVPDQLRPAAENMTRIVLDALLTDMTYETFETRFNDALDDASAALADHVTAQARQELPTGENVLADLDRATRDRVDRVRQVVSYVSVAGWLLPLLVLGLAAVFWLLAGSTAAALLGIGSVTAFAGLAATAVFTVVESVAVEQVREALTDAPAVATELVPGLIQQVTTAFSTQSTALLLLGIVLAAAGLAVRYRDRLPR
ncbi:MAG: hypothetical protein SV186_03265 [Candidatus Nanohaloarchaea archaeon]|nr:hypothetical protein [Candidatus Nanohaloarchaea archaeon]